MGLFEILSIHNYYIPDFKDCAIGCYRDYISVQSLIKILLSGEVRNLIMVLIFR